MNLVIPRTSSRGKNGFCPPLSGSTWDMKKPFEMRLPPMTLCKSQNISESCHTHEVNTCWPKLKYRSKKAKICLFLGIKNGCFLAIFWSLVNKCWLIMYSMVRNLQKVIGGSLISNGFFICHVDPERGGKNHFFPPGGRCWNNQVQMSKWYK